MLVRKEKEIKTIYFFIILIFILFLAIPIIRLLTESFFLKDGIGLSNYLEVFAQKNFGKIILNSVGISLLAAIISTILAFFLAYSIQYSNIPKAYKRLIRLLAVLPMLLPTITYGFAIIYSFGKQGLITKIIGTQIFEIYGFGGLLYGYVVYTLPISFMLILNTMTYIDKKFSVVSRVMGDNSFKTFVQTLFLPLLGTLASSVVQCFFLCFTDYGIPASIGGRFDVVASLLYNKMLGSIPDFQQGAVVAMLMLIPSIISISLLHYLERYNIRYNKISDIEIKKNKLRDSICFIGSAFILLCMLSIFLVIALIPFVEEWPYEIHFTLEHLNSVLADNTLTAVCKNSLFVAVLTAVTGTIITYGAALASARSNINKRLKRIIDSLSLITNTVPGMVIGIAYMLIFSGTPLQNTFIVIIFCNIVHFFSTPYLMLKNSLSKLNRSWETTAALMGDNWFNTLIRIVTPNMRSTLLEVFSYFFVNAMVTVSAVIFIAGTKTMVLTTKIKELQYYNKFNEVFVLSLFILAVNLLIKGLLGLIIKKLNNKEN